MKKIFAYSLILLCTALQAINYRVKIKNATNDFIDIDVQTITAPPRCVSRHHLNSGIMPDMEAEIYTGECCIKRITIRQTSNEKNFISADMALCDSIDILIAKNADGTYKMIKNK